MVCALQTWPTLKQTPSQVVRGQYWSELPILYPYISVLVLNCVNNELEAQPSASYLIKSDASTCRICSPNHVRNRWNVVCAVVLVRSSNVVGWYLLFNSDSGYDSA